MINIDSVFSPGGVREQIQVWHCPWSERFMQTQDAWGKMSRGGLQICNWVWNKLGPDQLLQEKPAARTRWTGTHWLFYWSFPYIFYQWWINHISGNDYHLRLICETVVNDALKPLCAMLGPPQTPPGPPTTDTAPPVKARSAQIARKLELSYFVALTALFSRGLCCGGLLPR